MHRRRKLPSRQWRDVHISISVRPARRTESSCFALFAAALLAVTTAGASAEQRRGGIVGLGATTCARFNEDIKANPGLRRDYFAWAQGFMSAIVLSRPPGVDQGLNLNPASFGLVDQVHYLESHCAQHISADFADAVEALYKRLRVEGKT